MEPPGGRMKHYYYYGLPQVTVDGQRPLRLRSDDTCGSAPPLNQQRKHRHRERSSCFFFFLTPSLPKKLIPPNSIPRHGYSKIVLGFEVRIPCVGSDTSTILTL